MTEHTCEFCEAPLPEVEPANVALLNHLEDESACKEQFEFMVENLHASWTLAVSGP